MCPWEAAISEARLGPQKGLGGADKIVSPSRMHMCGRVWPCANRKAQIEAHRGPHPSGTTLVAAMAGAGIVGQAGGMKGEGLDGPLHQVSQTSTATEWVENGATLPLGLMEGFR